MKKLCVGLVLAVFLSGCGLTAEQEAALKGYEASVQEVQARLATYVEQIDAIIARVQAGKIPLAEGTALLADIRANYEADREKLGGLEDSIAKLRNLNVPWWALIYAALTTVGTVAGVIKGVSLLGQRNAMVKGIEKSADPADVKASVAQEAVFAGVEAALHKAVKKLTGK